LKEYVAQFNGNSYLEALRTLNVHDEMYDINSGIQDKEMAILEQWIIDTNQYPSRVAIFDWDRTITVIEGINFMAKEISPASVSDIKSALLRKYPTALSLIQPLKDITAEDLLKYLLGGEERLYKMRNLFNTCFKNNVSLVILTNNGASIEPAFIDMLNNLFQGIPYQCIWSNDGRFKGKGYYLKENAAFKNLCTGPTIIGGKIRKRKTTKRKTTKRKTNKRKTTKRKTNKRKTTKRKTTKKKSNKRN
jgi:hypothetical protein